MIDDIMAERLSRYLDGDLDPRGTAELEARLRSDPDLQNELDALRRLQGAVRLVADGMQPPPELDTLLEPLRVGTPHAGRRIPPAFRWIGMAAGVALAVTVAMEVARHEPDPSIGRLAAESDRTTEAEDEGIFQLQPLPTSPVPEEQELVGAADRLLASPLAEPVADEPEPMVVQGPLPAPPAEKGGVEAPEPMAAERSNERRQPERGESARRDKAGALEAAPSAAMVDTAGAAKATKRPSTVAVVIQSTDGSEVARTELAVERSALPAEVEIRGGEVVAASPLAPEGGRRAASEQLIGHTVGGLADGRYRIIEAATTESTDTR